MCSQRLILLLMIVNGCYLLQGSQELFILPTRISERADPPIDVADNRPISVTRVWVNYSERLARFLRKRPSAGMSLNQAMKISLSRQSLERANDFLLATTQNELVCRLRMKSYSLAGFFDIMRSCEVLEAPVLGRLAAQHALACLTSQSEEFCSNPLLLEHAGLTATLEEQLRQEALSDKLLQELLPNFFSSISSTRQITGFTLNNSNDMLTLVAAQADGSLVYEYWDPITALKRGERILEDPIDGFLIETKAETGKDKSPMLTQIVAHTINNDRQSADILDADGALLCQMLLSGTILSIHPLGHALAVAREHGGAYIDLLGDRKEKELICRYRFKAGIFHPQKDRLATLTQNNEIRIWNCYDQIPIIIVTLDIPCSTLSYSNNGNMLLAQMADGAIRIWHDDVLLQNMFRDGTLAQKLMLRLIASIPQANQSIGAQVAPALAAIRNRQQVRSQDLGCNAAVNSIQNAHSAETTIAQLFQMSHAQQQLFSFNPLIIERLLHNAHLHTPDSEGRTLLYRALEAGSEEAISYLRTHGASLQAPDQKGATALHWAAGIAQPHIVSYVFAQDGCIDRVDSDGRTALHYAAGAGNDTVLPILLLHNADHQKKDLRGLTPLLLAAQEGHSGCVEVLLRHEMVGDFAAWEPLHFAVYKGYYAVIDFLTQSQHPTDPFDLESASSQQIAARKEGMPESRAEANTIHAKRGTRSNEEKILPINKRDSLGFTAIHRAVQATQRAIVQLFVNKRADVSGYADGDNRHLTPLHSAVETGDPDMVRMLLIAGAPLTARTKTGDSPLYYAAQRGFDTCAKVLLEFTSDHERMHDPNSRGLRPLHAAATGGHSTLVSLLLTNRASVDATSRQGQTALHCAIEKNHDEVAQLLLAAKADPNAQTTDQDKLSPLDCAVENDRFVCAQLLLAHGRCINKPGALLRTPVHRAAWLGRLELMKLFLESDETEKIRSIVNVPDRIGYTPLHWAAERGHGEIVALLLKAGALPGALDSWQMPPASRALEQGHREIAELLLLKELELEKAPICNKEWGPLHYATYKGYKQAVHLLLLLGAKAPCADLMHIAKTYGHNELIPLLRSDPAPQPGDEMSTDLAVVYETTKKE